MASEALAGRDISYIFASADSGSATSSPPEDSGRGAYYREIEIGKFGSREDAENLARKVRIGGFETLIRTDVTTGSTLYRVFILVHEKGSPEVLTGPAVEDIGPGEKDFPAENRPVGTLKGSEDLFGKRTSFFHPSLTLSELYTDNAFYTHDDKKTAWSTVLTPEIWFALPRINQKYLVFEDTSNRFAGGLIIDRYRPEVVRRYQTYLLYRADIPIAPSKNDPSGGTVTHNLYGSAAYNGNIFSAAVVDQFVRSYETRGYSIATQQGEVDRYISNLFDIMMHLDTGNKFRFRVDYSNFFIDYDDQRNDFRDRTDNGLAGYLFYQLQPRTAAFIEYDFLDINYRDDNDLDSREHHFFGGLQWDVTAKSRGTVKAGYSIKDFYNLGEKDTDFILEAEVSHHFSPRTTLTLTAFRKTTESAIEATLFAVTSEVGFNYQQILTSRITGSANLFYIRDKYRYVYNLERVPDIEDDTYEAGVGLQYEFQKRLRSSVGYTYSRRNSNYSQFDYTRNTVFFRVTYSL